MSPPPPRIRVVAHFDLDAFYVGCERELNPAALLGVPVAVSQYNPYGNLAETSASQVDERLIVRPGKSVTGDTNGSLIAVSYEARAASVGRNDRGRDAVRKCPELRIVQVPVRHGKADLSMYRDASYRVLNRLVQSVRENNDLSKAAVDGIRVEKASIDEIYIDLTSATDEMVRRIVAEASRDRLGNNDNGDSDNDNDYNINEGCSSSDCWHKIIHTSGAANCTTIGGVEKVNANARAANALSKDELRRGSHLQVLDSSAQRDDTMLDAGSRSWWQRSVRDMSDTDIALACGAALAARARSDVARHFVANKAAAADDADGGAGEVFTLSAGISANKTLSKLASGMKKPNRQTIINPDDEALQKLFHPLPVGRIRGLGAKLGAEVCRTLGVATVGDLAKLPLAVIQRRYPPSSDNDGMARFLFDISRGICTDEVDRRTLAKSIGCGKTFRNHLSLDPDDGREIERWAGELCGELTERLAADRRENSRTPELFGVSVSVGGGGGAVSRSAPAPRAYARYVETATKLILQAVGSSSRSRIEGLTVWANNFVEVANESNNIMAAFGRAPKSSGGAGVKHSAVASAKIARAQEQREKEQRGVMFKNVRPQRANNGNESNSSNAERTEKVEASDDSGAQLIGEVDDGIDPDVFSQLPPSIQAEIRMSCQAATASKVGDGSRSDRKGITRWLSNNGAGRKKVLTTAASPPSEPSPLFFRMEEIDQDTLAELPPDVKEGVLRDIEAAATAAESCRRSPERQRWQQQNQGKKRKRIDNFFAISDKK